MPYATVCTVQVWFVHIFANYELLLLIIELLNDGRGFIWSWKRDRKKKLLQDCVFNCQPCASSELLGTHNWLKSKILDKQEAIGQMKKKERWENSPTSVFCPQCA